MIALRRLVAVASVVLLCGCGSSSEEPPPVLRGAAPVVVSSRHGVEVKIQPTAPLHTGDNDLTIVFPAKKAVLLTANALMPAHGHGTIDPRIEATSDGFAVRELALFMSGRWELVLSLRTDTGTDEASVAIEVP